MLILGIDTSTDSVSVAIGDGPRVMAQSEAVSDRQHCEALVPMIDFVRQQAGVSFREIGAIAVDIGPGLFTGLRVGVAAAKAIAFSLDLPVIGISSLDVLAAAAPPTDSVIVSVIDARRNEIFWSMYRTIERDLTQVYAPCVGPVSELVVSVLERGQSALFVGNGALQYQSKIVESIGTSNVTSMWDCEFADVRFSRPTAATVVEMAHLLAINEQWLQADQLSPIYLRQPDAEINWATRVAS